MSDAELILRLNEALEGRYRILRELGEGGMATVYLAHDLKHEREIALKVLKPELGAVVGSQRFLAEIRTTANLQHPHILPLHDSGEADGLLFYVMPYVAEESLRDRLHRERQLPVDEAIRIATNLAEALDYAHRQGVIHRDIKPANILLQDGKPVVSDFGIALAVGAAGGGRLTETGLSLGTPHYMSPEQATGDASVGPAADIYALGCVLYQMLVGRPPFVASTPQAVLGKIVTEGAPSARAERKSVPSNADSAIRKALEKVPADRFAGAGAFADALADADFRHDPGNAYQESVPGNRWRAVAFVSMAVALLSVGAHVWPLSSRSDGGSSSRPVARFESLFRPSQAPVGAAFSAFGMSPDGSKLAYLGPSQTSTAGRQIWMRRWDDPVAVPLLDTDGALYPEMSQDGQQIVFMRPPELFHLSLDGGRVRRLAEGAYPRWGPDDEYVYFVRPSDGNTWRVRALGGEPERVRELGTEHTSLGVQDFLPGGRTALVQVGFVDGRSEVGTLSTESGELNTLIPGAWPTYVRTGHILYLTEVNTIGTLMAVPFDPDILEVTGPSQALIENVIGFSISDDGDLVYTTPTGVENLTELVWIDREGDIEPVDEGWRFDNIPQAQFGWSLSPGHERIAYTAESNASFDIWLKDLPVGPSRRLTFEGIQEHLPWWAPDGTRVAYLRVRGPRTSEAWARNADGTGQATRLIDAAPATILRGVWSADGEWIVLNTARAPNRGRGTIVAFRPGVDSTFTPILTSTDSINPLLHPAMSPDGRWLAYRSQGTVWVTPFPDADERWPVLQGAHHPLWAHSGKELFLVDAVANQLVSAAVETEPSFRWTGLDTLFAIPPEVRRSPWSNFYDVSSNDQHFLMGRAAGDGTREAWVLVQNFFDELCVRMGDC